MKLLPVVNGVYRTTEGVRVFHAVRTPIPAELQVLLTRTIKPLMGLLTRKSYLIEEESAAASTELTRGALHRAAAYFRPYWRDALWIVLCLTCDSVLII